METAMGDRPHAMRLVGLTTLMIGLIGIFASLTLVAVSRPGLAALFAITGVIVAVVGLRALPNDAP
jgi:hypothetical protein